jgi:rhamnulokinase
MARSRTTDYLAIDLGASNGRVVAGRWDGARFELRDVHRFDNGPVGVLGHLHWDVLRLWSEIRTGIARHAADGMPIGGLGVDTWGVDFGLLDVDGALLGNPFHYRDRRTDGMMAAAFEVVPRGDVFRSTGVGPMPINTLFQLFSMVREGSAQLRAARTLLPIPNLFTYWLSGEPVAEYTHATTTQCLDVGGGAWALEILERLGIPSGIFPPIVEPGTVLGPLAADVAEDAGLAARPPVVAVGCHDSASAVAAIPGLDRSSAYISSGTWSVMGVETDRPVVTDEALELGFTNEGGVGRKIRLLRNIPGLWLLQECRRAWQRAGDARSWEDLLAAAEAAPSFGSVVDPDAAGLASAADMPSAIAAECQRTGQPPPVTVGAVARCCLESLALRYRETLRDLEACVGHPLGTIRIVGGGSRNRLLNQLTADACERPVVAGPVEAAALGNVMLQAVATGELAGVGEGRTAIAASAPLERYEPRPDGGRWQAIEGRLRRPKAGAPA